jgi:hypothetical protein
MKCSNHTAVTLELTFAPSSRSDTIHRASPSPILAMLLYCFDQVLVQNWNFLDHDPLDLPARATKLARIQKQY